MSLLDNYSEQLKSAPAAGSVASTSQYTALTLQSKLPGGTLVSIVGGAVTAVAAAAAADGVIIASFDDSSAKPAAEGNVAIMDSGDIWIPFTGAVVAGDKVEAASGVAVKKLDAGKAVGIATKVIANSACVRLA